MGITSNSFSIMRKWTFRDAPSALVRSISLAYENSPRSMGYLETATFQQGLPEGTACGLEVQTRAGDADFKK